MHLLRPPIAPGRPRPPHGRHGPPRAFTLVELLVVITVIAILAGMLLAGIRAASRAARRNATKQLLRQVATAVAGYHDTHGERPPERTPGASRLYSPECLAVFLGAGLLPTEAGFASDAKRAIRSKRSFLTLKSSLVTDENKNGFPEVVDAWGLPIVYNRAPFSPHNANFADANLPLHNPNSYDLFSCGPLASRMAALGRQLPNLANYENNAIEANPSPAASKYRYLYRYEFQKVEGRANEYLGNW